MTNEEFNERRRKIVWLDECNCVFPKKYFTVKQAEEMLALMEQPKDKAYIEWRNKFTDEEFEKKFKIKKKGNFKITGEAYVRFKRAKEEGDADSIWSNESYTKPYLSDIQGRGAMQVWTCDYNFYFDMPTFDTYFNETHRSEVQYDN